jgi:ribonuclease P protein component
LIGRLHYKRDFDNLRINGKTLKRGFLSVVFNPSDNFADGVRVAFAIGRPVGGSVVRNRIKRRLREAFVRMNTKNELVPKGDYLIRVFPEARNKSFLCLSNNLEKVIEDLRKDHDLSV